MQRNVEVKAIIMDMKTIIARVEKLSGSKGVKEKQLDIYLKVPQGRFKYRTIEDEISELIYYERPDCEGPTLGLYTRCQYPMEARDTLAILRVALGTKGIVEKTRRTFSVDQIRINIDHVHKLGTFLELKVMLLDSQTEEEGQAIANELMAQLGVEENYVLSESYVDLLKR